MKKTLIALAAVAATGAVFAQSSVTIYGKMDIGLSNAIGGATKAETGLNQAAGSRLGFRGAEDLGGGLKANFWLEHRFEPDTGAISNSNPAQVFWNGSSTVGLSGGFGSVNLGRTYTPAFYQSVGSDVFGWDGVANNVVTTGTGTNAVRMANGIFYSSPSMGGFMVQAAVALKESAAATAKDGYSLRASYAVGPFSIDAAAERNTNQNEYQGIGGSYNFGVAKANVLINRGELASAPGVDRDGLVFGLVVPMGAVTLKASYATLEVGNSKVVSKLGLGARYALSKRTDLYTSFARDSEATIDKTGFEIGMQHNF